MRVSPDGEWQAGAALPFVPQAGRQVLSTLFNQVSIKAERDPALLTVEALRALSFCDRYSGFRSKRPATPPGRAGAKRKIALESVESEKGGRWRGGAMNLITKYRPRGLENRNEIKAG
ncbi:hypothetical protein AN396_11665 [Candidatus Epulonipiscium fishelsonii]|uniref:Uncharacterized protein n=1 Tax=Candidatus Epulonipiscium fishelsonii TaxID=77094 RepID=A0ACC8X842_9FIRM|nr:hypothetical protein AN396_11665 [Epulopiscium sp. SCG-B11WGA-EpuloA1]